jgi:hypothetical protein
MAVDENDPLLPPMPVTVRFERTDRPGFPGFRTPCPWCDEVLPWCISWIASWGELCEHYGRAHRDIQIALKARLT